MSAHNIVTQMEDGIVSTAGTNGKVLFWENAAPTNGVAGYATGCLWINTAGSSTTTRIYINGGTNASAAWKSITTAA
jgi:hypothetical protein